MSVAWVGEQPSPMLSLLFEQMEPPPAKRVAVLTPCASSTIWLFPLEAM